MDNEKPNIKQLENLSTVWQTFADSFYEEKTFTLLYASNKCFLGLVNKDGNVEVKSNELDLAKVFEARIFNGKAELRWLKGFGEKIISDADFPNCETIPQNYLIWGKKNAPPNGNWTQFATARIGSFYVPENINSEYAQFTAVEYLKEFADGNIAVCDERLTGITEVK
ncbi:MAG: type III-D CRISPR-associated protein Csx19 [Pyrinomonadaceae bacterium]